MPKLRKVFVVVFSCKRKKQVGTGLRPVLPLALLRKVLIISHIVKKQVFKNNIFIIIVILYIFVSIN